MADFPFVSLFIVGSKLICHLIDLKYALPSKYINFSGESVVSRKYYVLFTFGFFHGNTSHLIQQLTLSIALLIPLENKIGSMLLFLLYFICGILGTLITWRIDRIYYSRLYVGTGAFLADCIWSRGSSGHVYGLCGLSSILCTNEFLFQYHSIFIHYGLIWTLITNFLFHLFSSKSYFTHYPMKSYPILIIFCLIILHFGPNKVAINQYLILYFIHLSVWRLYPQTFNIRQESFIASDFKSHLIGAGFGVLFGVIFAWINGDWNSVTFASLLPFFCILISDGICGQYMVHRRIQFNLAKMKAAEVVRSG